ncbi:MAG: alpha-mannosidase [Kiritimatiellaeota bacterium]|nr:alpha-mannosidase [Kiritimatiellota bacterium]
MRIHLIGNAHLDPVWLWRWPEGLAEARSTFRSALDRMTEDPDFIFTCAAAAIYEWIEKTEPELFGEIRERVEEGRWRITGGWWIQADCNIPSGESFVRQGLYAQRYFQERFGVRCRCGYCVDSFGHCATLPKLLRGCGLDAWVWMRPGEHENPALPKPYFFWETEDGSRVVSLRISDQAYSCWDPETLEKRILALRERYKSTGPTDLMCFYGVGDHGGGPTRAQLAAVRDWRDRPDMPRLEHSFPEKVLGAVQGENLPVYRGELQHHASGCYAAVSGIKTLNRRAETALFTAEAWSVAAWLLTGWPPAPAEMSTAWKHLLFNQFHDILAGTSLPEAYEDASAQIEAALYAADWRRNAAQQRISWRIDTRGDGSPVVVFNNSAAPFSGIVETEDFGFGPNRDTGVFVDARGGPVASQEILSHSVTWRRRVLLELTIPAFGYRLLRLLPARDASSFPPRSQPVRVRKNGLENQWLRLRVTREGAISLTDKRTGRRTLGSPAGRAVVIDDSSDTWSHGVFRFDGEEDMFRFDSARVVESGPLRGRIRTVFRYGPCSLRLDYTLGAGEPFVGIDGLLDWHLSQKVVKVLFPVRGAATNVHTSEVPYGTIQRSNNGDEEPMQRWIDLSGPGVGLVIVNDCKYSYDVRKRTARITLLRSPYFAHHLPAQPARDLEQAVTDQGEQRFRLRLIPHSGDWRSAGIPGLTAQLHAPPNALFEGNHPGAGLPADGGLLECTPSSIDVGAVKPAEDGAAVIVRAVETAGASTRASFRVPSLSLDWTATFRPGEIKTFALPVSGRGPIREVNFLEEDQPE